MDTILEVYYVNFFSELVHSVPKLHEILIKIGTLCVHVSAKQSVKELKAI